MNDLIRLKSSLNTQAIRCADQQTQIAGAGVQYATLSAHRITFKTGDQEITPST